MGKKKGNKGPDQSGGGQKSAEGAQEQSNQPPGQLQQRGPPQAQLRGPPPQQQWRGPPPQQQWRGPPPQQQWRGPPPQQQWRGPPPQQQWRGPPPQLGGGAPFQIHQTPRGPPQQSGGPPSHPGQQKFRGPRPERGRERGRSPQTQQSGPPQQPEQVVQETPAQKPAWGQKQTPSADSPASSGTQTPTTEKGPTWGKPPVSEPPPSQEPALPAKDAETTAAPSKKKGKGKKGGDQPKQEPKPSTTVSEVTKTMGKTQITSTFKIPSRKEGKDFKHTSKYIEKSFTLEVNYLPINFKNINLQIYHYDVTFKPEAPKSLFRPALKKLFDENRINRYPAFDGKKNLYAAGTPIKFPQSGDTYRQSVTVHDPERLMDKEFDITIKMVDQNLNLSSLMEYMKNGTSTNIPQDVIQGTDIALRHSPVLRFIQVGRSFFTPPPERENPVDLGGGFDLWHGYYQSAIMAWKPYLNVDVANKAFPRAQPLLDYLRHELRVENFNYPLDRAVQGRFYRFIKGLKVEYSMPSRDGGRPSIRTYKIDNIGDIPSNERFKPKENERETTVLDYYQREKGYRIRYPNLPVLKTTNKSSLPIELCNVAGSQVVMRKLDERQTATMVRNAARPTDERKARIMRTIGQSDFNNDPCLREFGISVGMNFENVDAVVLKPPRIGYKGENACNVRNGVWRADGHQFINSPGLNDWIIINTDSRKVNQGNIQNLIKNFKIAGGNLGMDVSEPRQIITEDRPDERKFIELFQKYRGIQLAVVVMNQFIDDIYGKVKRAAELRSGMLTQCLKAATLDFRKMNVMTATNILLKINSKLAGVNHTLYKPIRPQILKEPVMIVGADVTHPAPGSEGISIAAVAASHDSYGFQYNMLYRLQPGRREMIDDLESMIIEQLKFFRSKTNVKPKRILYYRDGVSEGQFQQVLDIELRAIRAACQKLETDYKPGITFLVVQKRHHTRFFPGNGDWDGPKNKNVVAGTLVDSKITHPTETDFYLVSHQSIQGTARPTKYHLLWDDNDIGTEELEQLTYYLCHMFARCNRSVSYPAPTYYAHLAAFRARAWWDGIRFNPANLVQEQLSQGSVKENIISNTPMFFV